MKKKLMKAGAITLAIALFAACGSGDEPRNSTDAETGTSRTETRAAARTPVPMPTRPKRIDHLLTPTALPGAIKEKPAKTSEPEAKQASEEQASNGAAKTVTGDPKTIAQLVPEDPRTNDRVLLQDIYAQIDLEQFALDPDQPIPWGGKYYAESLMPHPVIHQHPYLHLFPDLEAKVREWGERDIQYSPYGIFSHRFKDISGIRNGLIYFIYNPWFEPVFPASDERTPDYDGPFFKSSSYKYSGAGPYWFGNNSVRGVLAETVAELLEEAKLPSAEPAQAPWFQRNPTRNTDLGAPEMQKLTMEEFISTTISSEDGWFCSSRPRSICDIMEETHITPWVEWEILHPQLPILKITAHADQTLPLAPAGLEKIWQDDRISIKPRYSRNMSTKYSVSFVISLQNRWASFDDPNRWIIRFKDELYFTKPWELDPELPYPNYWDDTGYMQHRIIGPVVLTVHEYKKKDSVIPVLKHGNYSRAPSIAHWEAPGHILTDEQKRTFKVSKAYATYPDQRALEAWPNLGKPNAGFPLPGHVLTGPKHRPGTKRWKEYGMEGYDW